MLYEPSIKLDNVCQPHKYSTNLKFCFVFPYQTSMNVQFLVEGLDTSVVTGFLFKVKKTTMAAKKLLCLVNFSIYKPLQTVDKEFSSMP